MKHRYLKTFTKSLSAFAPVSPAVSAGNANGTVIDLVAEPEVGAGVVVINTGTPTGSPSSFSAVYKLQTSTDNFSADTTDVASVTVTAAGINVIGFEPIAMSQYLRLRRELAFVSGSSPTLPDSAVFVLGDPKYAPLAGN